MHRYPDNVTAMAMLLTSMTSLASLGAVFFAGDAIAGEYESKTGFLLFTNPIKREILWAGKYIAGLVAVSILMLFTYLIVAGSLLVIHQEVPVAIFKSFGMALYYGAAVLSTTFLFSALSRGLNGRYYHVSAFPLGHLRHIRERAWATLITRTGSFFPRVETPLLWPTEASNR